MVCTQRTDFTPAPTAMNLCASLQDRFFSRLVTALRGNDYWTLREIEGVTKKALKYHDVCWEHLSCSWDWTELRARLGIEIRRLRNVQSYELFRTEAGIFVKWRQWMTDEHWSRPVQLLRRQDMDIVQDMRPSELPHKFSAQDASGMLSFLEKLEALLMASGEDRSQQLAWLRRVINHQEPSLSSHPSIEQILQDIKEIAGGRPALAVASQAEFPSDVLVQLFPGHDAPSLPADSLMTVSSSFMPSSSAQEALCVPGDWVITSAKERPASTGMVPPFWLGQVLEISSSGDSALVRWYQPPLAKQSHFRPGRRKEVLDVFGKWEPIDQVPLANLPEPPMPLLRPEEVLEWGFELQDHLIPFAVFDKLLDYHGIDMTSLSQSSTSRGNLYRTHRLMGAIQ